MYPRRASSSAFSASAERHDVDMEERFRNLVSSPRPSQSPTHGLVVEDLQELCKYLHLERDRLEHELDASRQNVSELEHELRSLQDSTRVLERAAVESASAMGMPVHASVHASYEPAETVSMASGQSAGGGLTGSELRNLIRETEREIQLFDPVYAREVLVEGVVGVGASNPAAEYQMLVARRFKRMDQFILCLKKRIQKLESIEAGLGVTAAKYGSVTKLVEDNQRLEKENKKLREREVRYAPSSLLRRRNLMECSHSFLVSLTKALQNELSAAREIIDKYNYERNPELKLLIRPPCPEVIPRNVQQLVNQEDPIEQENSEDDTLCLSSSGLHDKNRLEKLMHENQRLSQQLVSIEHANIAFRQQVQRLQDERYIRNRIQEDYPDVLMASPDIKAKKIRDLSKLNNELLTQIEELHDKLKSKDEHIQSLEDFQFEWSEKIRLLEDDNASLSRKCLHKQSEISRFRDALKSRSEGLHVLYSISLTLMHVFLERYSNVSGVRGHASSKLENFYRDAVDLYLTTNQAASRIQAMVRGRKTRQILQTKGIPVKPPKKVSATLSAFQEASVQLACTSEEVSTPHLSRPAQGSLFSLLRMIHQAVTVSNVDLSSFMQLKNVLRLIKVEVLDQVKEDTSRIIQTFQEELSRTLHELQLIISERLGLEKDSRSTQTPVCDMHDAQVECDIPTPPPEVPEEPIDEDPKKKGKKK